MVPHKEAYISSTNLAGHIQTCQFPECFVRKTSYYTHCSDETKRIKKGEKNGKRRRDRIGKKKKERWLA